MTETEAKPVTTGTCRRCDRPIEPCHCWGVLSTTCRGWLHMDGWHMCHPGSPLVVAEPAPKEG